MTTSDTSPIEAVSEEPSPDQSSAAATPDQSTPKTTPGDTTDDVDGVRWHIGEDENPFNSQLVFTDNGDAFLTWHLDPLTLNGFIGALGAVRDAQLAALGAPAPEADAPPESPRAPHPDASGLPTNPAQSQQQGGLLAFCLNHKLLTFLFLFMATFFVLGFIAGGRHI